MAETDVTLRNADLAEIENAKTRFIERRQELSDYLAEDLSESDTRSKFIDLLLKDILGWKESLIRRESHVTDPDGFIDYVLSTTRPYFIVEAKRKNYKFSIPEIRTRHQYKVGGVLAEDKRTHSAMTQARDYAASHGIPFCCVTNGIQFLFFRSQNDHGVEWKNHIVIAFRDHDDIEKNFSKFYHLLSYDSISAGAVHTHLPVTHDYDEALKRFRLCEASSPVLERTRERNKLFPIFRDIISKVFQDISGDQENIDLLKYCYVESPRESSYEKGLDGLLRNRPVAFGSNVREIVVSKTDAGEFQNEFDKSVSRGSGSPEILLILGGIGVGKTTFINRFRRIFASDKIDSQCLWAYVDFTHYTDDGTPITTWIANEIFKILSRDYPTIDIETFNVLKQAYHSEYERLKRGRLQPVFSRSPQEFDVEFAKELFEYEKSSAEHLVRVLRTAAAIAKRRPFLVFDNADQFESQLQNEVFLVAQKFAKDIGCASIISLREESYWKNKEFGALSAFHSVSFHVQAPRLVQVLSKRFRYAKSLLDSANDRDFIDSDYHLVKREDVLGVLNQLTSTILDNDKKILSFLEHMSPGEIRRALDQLARFLYSGHTNMDALLSAASRGVEIKVGFHEFITSVILGDREYYSEATSDVINLFAVDGRADASNLNRIALLGRILRDERQNTEYGKGFAPIAEIITDCETLGIAPDTVRSLLALFNKRRLLETETQVREDINVSAYVRATAAADYYLRQLVYDAAYVDIMVSDTAIGDGTYFDKLQRATAEIAQLTGKKANVRLDRLEKRLERGRIFVNYINAEYEKSTLKENLHLCSDAVKVIFESIHGKYTAESHRIMKQARAIFQRE